MRPAISAITIGLAVVLSVAAIAQMSMATLHGTGWFGMAQMMGGQATNEDAILNNPCPVEDGARDLQDMVQHHSNCGHDNHHHQHATDSQMVAECEALIQQQGSLHDHNIHHNAYNSTD